SLSTNSIHRLWWKDAAFPLEAGAVGSWTTLFSLLVELNGRGYGGGVLKLEPGAATSIPIPMVQSSERNAPEIDYLARRGSVDAAMKLADQVILREGMGMDLHDMSVIRETLRTLASRRRTGPL